MASRQDLEAGRPTCSSWTATRLRTPGISRASRRFWWAASGSS